MSKIKLPFSLLFSKDNKLFISIKNLFNNEEVAFLMAKSEREGHHFLSKYEIALIIWDWNFINNQEELIKKIQKLNQKIKNLIIVEDEESHKKYINKMPCFNLFKLPHHKKEILFVVKDALKRYQLNKENERLQNLVNKKELKIKEINTKMDEKISELIIHFEMKIKGTKIDNEKIKYQVINVAGIFSSLIDSRNNVANHSKNVAALSRLIAESMSLKEVEIKTIEFASLMHDIGKISIPEDILHKSKSELDCEEKELIRTHVVKGQAAVELMGVSKEVANIIRHHHERYDGSGYPDKLSGNEIPLGSRIISIADTIVNMVNTKNPCNKYAFQKAMWYLESERSKGYDPYVYKFIVPVIHKWTKNNMGNIDYQEEILSISDLSEGKRVSRDIQSGTGIVLVPKGTILTHEDISKLKYHTHIDPLEAGIYVWREPNKNIHTVSYN